MCQVSQAAVQRGMSGSKSQLLMKKSDIELDLMILDGQDLVIGMHATATINQDPTTTAIIEVVEATNEEPPTERSVKLVMVGIKMEIFSFLISQDHWCHTNSLQACKITVFQIYTSNTKNTRKIIHKTMPKLF